MTKSGLYLEHGSHFRNAMKVCINGEVKGSYNHELHEFGHGEEGVHCSPVSSPDLPGGAYKSDAHKHATLCHMQSQNEPEWDLYYDYMTQAQVLEQIEEPMYKLIFVLAETEQGEQHRARAHTHGNNDWSWVYPEPMDLHLCYARILIGLPPQPEKFRYGRYYVDEREYEGIRQVFPRDRDENGSLA